jgi:hypothetical protein
MNIKYHSVIHVKENGLATLLAHAKASLTGSPYECLIFTHRVQFSTQDNLQY